MNGCFFQYFSKVYGKIWVVFCLNTGKGFFFRGFILKPTEGAYVFLKNGTSDFQNSPPFERSACFLCDNHWKF